MGREDHRSHTKKTGVNGFGFWMIVLTKDSSQPSTPTSFFFVWLGWSFGPMWSVHCTQCQHRWTNFAKLSRGNICPNSLRIIILGLMITLPAYFFTNVELGNASKINSFCLSLIFDICPNGESVNRGWAYQASIWDSTTGGDAIHRLRLLASGESCLPLCHPLIYPPYPP